MANDDDSDYDSEEGVRQAEDIQPDEDHDDNHDGVADFGTVPPPERLYKDPRWWPKGNVNMTTEEIDALTIEELNVGMAGLFPLDACEEDFATAEHLERRRREHFPHCVNTTPHVLATNLIDDGGLFTVGITRWSNRATWLHNHKWFNNSEGRELLTRNCREMINKASVLCLMKEFDELYGLKLSLNTAPRTFFDARIESEPGRTITTSKSDTALHCSMMDRVNKPGECLTYLRRMAWSQKRHKFYLYCSKCEDVGRFTPLLFCSFEEDHSESNVRDALRMKADYDQESSNTEDCAKDGKHRAKSTRRKRAAERPVRTRLLRRRKKLPRTDMNPSSEEDDDELADGDNKQNADDNHDDESQGDVDLASWNLEKDRHLNALYPGDFLWHTHGIRVHAVFYHSNTCEVVGRNYKRDILRKRNDQGYVRLEMSDHILSGAFDGFKQRLGRHDPPKPWFHPLTSEDMRQRIRKNFPISWCNRAVASSNLRNQGDHLDVFVPPLGEFLDYGDPHMRRVDMRLAWPVPFCHKEYGTGVNAKTGYEHLPFNKFFARFGYWLVANLGIEDEFAPFKFDFQQFSTFCRSWKPDGGGLPSKKTQTSKQSCVSALDLLVSGRNNAPGPEVKRTVRAQFEPANFVELRTSCDLPQSPEVPDSQWKFAIRNDECHLALTAFHGLFGGFPLKLYDGDVPHEPLHSGGGVDWENVEGRTPPLSFHFALEGTRSICIGHPTNRVASTVGECIIMNQSCLHGGTSDGFRDGDPDGWRPACFGFCDSKFSDRTHASDTLKPSEIDYIHLTHLRLLANDIFWKLTSRTIERALVFVHESRRRYRSFRDGLIHPSAVKRKAFENLESNFVRLGLNTLQPLESDYTEKHHIQSASRDGKKPKNYNPSNYGKIVNPSQLEDAKLIHVVDKKPLSDNDWAK